MTALTPFLDPVRDLPGLITPSGTVKFELPRHVAVNCVDAREFAAAL